MAEPTELFTGDLSKDRLRLWLRLLKAGSAVEDEIRRRLRSEFDSTLPRFDVMSALLRFPEGLKMSQISKLLKVSNGNITGIVDKLADEGLALRVPVPGDRRASLVTLTPKGQTAFRAQARAHESWVNELLGGLSGQDIETVSALLDSLVAAPGKRE
ncbi:MarR family winged helix-turn-helix transcriptional regulator [Leisingera thetidis]|uniref:MarR family winged helix-turn-helix transcriptional regulator n=1 Tax=Leisingera thetidis TaxID=2930199 RepID=UPI0021F6DC89|nr:MarR family transcriptional regulator [Leisingera thetidis]